MKSCWIARYGEFNDAGQRTIVYINRYRWRWLARLATVRAIARHQGLCWAMEPMQCPE